jgi:hypothetical protein
MKVEPRTAEGIALDWAVGQCDRRTLYLAKSKRLMTANYGTFNHRHGAPWYEPSSNWLQGGRIIQSNRITLDITDTAYDDKTDECIKLKTPEWWSSIGEVTARGSTPLIAAMRCFVASRLEQAGLATFELPPDVADAYKAELARHAKYMKQRERWLKISTELLEGEQT